MRTSWYRRLLVGVLTTGVAVGVSVAVAVVGTLVEKRTTARSPLGALTLAPLMTGAAGAGDAAAATSVKRAVAARA